MCSCTCKTCALNCEINKQKCKTCEIKFIGYCEVCYKCLCCNCDKYMSFFYKYPYRSSKILCLNCHCEDQNKIYFHDLISDCGFIRSKSHNF